MQPAAIEDAVRIERRLELAVQRARASGRSGWNTPAALVARRETASRGRRAPRPTRAPCAASARSSAASQRSAPPHSISCSPPRSVYGAVDLHRQAPQRRAVASRGREERVRVVAHASSRTRRRRAPRCAAELRDRGLDRRLRAGQAHAQAAIVKARRRQRQRLAAPFVGAADRLVGRALERDASLRSRGSGRHLSDTSVMTPSVPSAPVISRDTSKPATFFITRPPNVRCSPVAVEHLHAEHEVAHGAGVGPARPRQTAGDGAAERAAGAEVRRLEREHLAARAHRALDRRRATCRRAR